MFVRLWNEYLRIMRNQRGAYLVLMVTILPLILIFTGLAVDLGRGYSHRAKLQNAADAAVMAAANIYYPNKDRDEVYEWAERYMNANRGDQTYKIDQITVRHLKDAASGDDTGGILLSVYASELVPVSFMAIAGFDAIPVDVVATAKITPSQGSTDPGVWGYSFICGDDRVATECGNVWDGDNGNLPFVFLQSKHKIFGAVHTNGAIGLNGGWEAYSAMVKTGNFSTSLTSDELLWKHYQLDGFHNEDGSAKNDLFINDIEVSPGVWHHYTRMGYFDMTTVNKDIVAGKSPTITTSKVDISLSSSNKQTEAIYDYVEKMRKQYGNTHMSEGDGIFINANGNYDSSQRSDFDFTSYSYAKQYNTIVVDGSVLIYADQYPDQRPNTDDHLTIISLHGDVTLYANSPVKALIYAPNGKVNFVGTESDENVAYSFEGSIVGKRLLLNGKSSGAYVTYKWNDFGFGSGTGSGSSGSGSGGSSSTGSASSVIMYKDVDSNYGDETAI